MQYLEYPQNEIIGKGGVLGGENWETKWGIL
jgi:hypothetical protein